ncbi:RNA lariat debranching enzyme [Aspergillus fischeri NRRL 181]|uniref:RNA lariat debranching enzyme, putative n=1 Tax=Neosartorya fischeri (strain ATCC 1020 / DSM 3700 / CBS 544.65 / FGSC A1164 / JCM 1740 / NRRL 181 / WB 181) TaxID=331117 RepID=A1DN95_NEOFI|nr:RNA lariat debranching enzyme, putative [Aspergillus fischeri NRRL 181]EAW16266.1 RNA lariat debranching enzyme, putative [Aspergillus fischeri NRRL 181]
MEVSTANPAPLRVAFEGCGHGRLDDIYDSVARSATRRGWDGVDLVVIGGDFQAVRNSNDLACMSVPQKYKAIGDFHEYYSGKKTAPYLTIFIGGNHEASNYLFELYYGGWVAPNIYYLGAANVIRCGPLRIAGLSGIWKGYDYRKPHFERLPYNNDDVQSIYHVDLGLSHDWPNRVELCGDHETLFAKKHGFREDSNNGRLGSIAARFVLDRLRPAFWFSAHLHVKFNAVVQHGNNLQPDSLGTTRHIASSQRTPSNASTLTTSFGMDGAVVTSLVLGDEDLPTEQAQVPHDLSENNGHAATTHGEDERLEEPPRELPAAQATQQSNPVGLSHTSSPLKRVHDDNQSRISAWNNFHAVAARDEAAENARRLEEPQDNSASQLPHSLTWRKISVDEDDPVRKVTKVEKPVDENELETKKQKTGHAVSATKNSDEIPLDLDSDSDQEISTATETLGATQKQDAVVAQPAAPGVTGDGAPKPSGTIQQDKPQVRSLVSQDVRNLLPASFSRPEGFVSQDVRNQLPASFSRVDGPVSQDVRNQLPSSFSRPQATPKPDPSVSEPVPETITNKTTRFLALDKCEPKRHFLELLEIPIVSEQNGSQRARPFCLEYDKEWLAITRVFADDLQLGDPAVQMQPDRGQAFYKPLIEEAEQWVEENVVKAGKMMVPDNFTPTAPFFDPAVPITTDELPPEFTNPQTAQFCELIGIENKFHLSDEERQARVEAGPRPNKPKPEGGWNRGRRRNYNNNNRGGGSQWRGRGAGRGQGRSGGNQRW